MRRRFSVLMSLVLAGTLGAAPPTAPEHGIGIVHMPISCGADANARFDRGLALLHNFWYDRALTEFDGVVAAHPDCAIAYWGAAMTYNHPLWAPPNATDVKAALAVLERAKGASTADDREARYVAAVRTLYGDGDPAGKPARDVAYRDAMRAILTSYPDDETKLFTALAILGVHTAADPERLQAAALAEAVHQHQPQHPGALHYLIHAYDSDVLAERGLPAARAYAASAPAIPHVLHMPSHIFLRLGLWDEARDSNLASWKASEDAVRAAGEPQSNRQFHNLEFGQYASLQLGRYGEARAQAVIALDQFDDNVRTVARGGLSKDEVDELLYLDFEAAGMASEYMASSGDYSLLPRLPAEGRTPIVSATLVYIRALAAAASEDRAAMQTQATRAQSLLDQPPRAGTLAARVATVMANEALAAMRHARHDEPGALAAIRAAVAAEDAQPSHVQPAMPAIPAHELYARMLMESGQYADAAREYRTALRYFPNRALAMLGAARALRASGDAMAAQQYAAAFAAMWSHADAGRPELAEAIALR